MTPVRRSLACLLALASCAIPMASAAPARPRTVAPTAGPALKAAPAFSLTDADGKARALADYRGRPVALFFFCGCPWCIRCAQDWGQFQRGGALPGAPTTPSGAAPSGAAPLGPVTLVVFSGDAAAARDFARTTGLDMTQTVLLPDTRMHVTLDLYNAEPCPRVFVLDALGRRRYTNDHGDDAARKAPEMVIASRALDALRACQADPRTSPTKAR